MKKILTLLATLAVAFSLTMPVFAKRGQGKGQVTEEKKEATKAEGKEATAKTSKHGKRHWLHARKKGATKGKKEGQAMVNPGNAPATTPKQ